MKRNNGSKSEEIFIQRLEQEYGAKNVYVEKFTDTKQVKGKNLSGFVKATPADFIVTASGSMFYAEVKSCSNKTSFPFSQFTTSQRRAMIRQKAAGGVYLVYLHNLVEDEWYVVSGPVLLEIEKNEGVKSIKWKDLGAARWRI